MAVKLSDDFINEVKSFAKINKRSVPKQIEYWSSIGRIAEENPDLSYNFIKEIMIAKLEANSGNVSEYKFGDHE